MAAAREVIQEKFDVVLKAADSPFKILSKSINDLKKMIDDVREESNGGKRKKRRKSDKGATPEEDVPGAKVREILIELLNDTVTGAKGTVGSLADACEHKPVLGRGKIDQAKFDVYKKNQKIIKQSEWLYLQLTERSRGQLYGQYNATAKQAAETCLRTSDALKAKPHLDSESVLQKWFEPQHWARLPGEVTIGYPPNGLT